MKNPPLKNPPLIDIDYDAYQHSPESAPHIIPTTEVTLRDLFAGLVCAALASRGTAALEHVAAHAYRQADALLAARARGDLAGMEPKPERTR